MDGTALKDQATQKVADVVTEVVGDAAGAVADPKTALSKGKGALRRRMPMLIVLAIGVVVLLIARRSNS